MSTIKFNNLQTIKITWINWVWVNNERVNKFMKKMSKIFKVVDMDDLHDIELSYLRFENK